MAIQIDRLPIYGKNLPSVYDNAIGYWEQLRLIVNKVNEIIDVVDQSDYVIDIKELQDAVAELQKMVDDIAHGEYVDLYLQSIIDYLDENLAAYIGRMMKFVEFGLTDDGHFCAWVTPYWDFLTFDTGAVYGTPEYGRLMINF